MSAPPAKKQKTEETEAKDEEMKEEEKPAVKEPPKELETDAAADKGPKVKETVSFPVADTTMNIMPCGANNVLMTLTEGGMQHLLAGARANVGIKSGRYMFEVKTIEHLNPMGDQNPRGVKPKNMVKVGFATAGSDLLLAGEGCVGFDSEGHFCESGKKTRVCGKFGRDSVVSVLLNLDASSPNANTVSLFIGGKRATQPQALPDSLKGKALFPAVAFRNATLHTNFGPAPLAELPFKCRMVQDASAKDAEVAKSKAPADGKYEVVVPVGLPDEGTFDWLDTFLAKNPGYIELSDRMVLDWADKSGIWRTKSNSGSADKPSFNFGLRELEDFSIRRTLLSIAPMQQRNYVVMELKDNLMKDSRKSTLDRFVGFKKTAQIVVGEPPAAFKKKTQEMTLKAKQDASDAAFRVKKAQEKRQKMMEKRQKAAEKAKKKAAAAKAKAAEAAKKKAEAAKAKAEGKEVPEEEEKKEEPEEEEEEEEPEEQEEEDNEEPPKVELDAEEKKLWFQKKDVSDMSSYVLSANFTKFTIPEKDEGFDDVKFEWAKDAAAFLKKWILEKKLSLKVEELQPSQWFFGKVKQWNAAQTLWHAKLNGYKQKLAQKAAKKAKKEADAKRKAAMKAAAEAKRQKAIEEAKEKGEEPPAEEPAPMEEEPEEPEEEEEEVDFDTVDVFGLDDVSDIGGGMPVFKDFQFEDWAMMSLHFELHLLAHAFQKDVNDPERPGMLVEHIPFYFNKYYRKQLVPKSYGVDTIEELVAMASDSVKVTANGTLESLMEEDMESLQVFVQMTEEARRYRKYKLDLGEESAKLKVTQAAHQMPSSAGYGAAKGAGKGFGPRFSPYPAARPLMPGTVKKGVGKGA